MHLKSGKINTIWLSQDKMNIQPALNPYTHPDFNQDKMCGNHEKQSKILQTIRRQQLNYDLDKDKYNLTKDQYINILLKVRQIF
jgi:hypothetical protein